MPTRTFIEIKDDILFISALSAKNLAPSGLSMDGLGIPPPPGTIWAACSWKVGYDACDGVLITAQTNGQFRCFRISMVYKTMSHSPIKWVESISQVETMLQNPQAEYAILKRALNTIGLPRMTQSSLSPLLTNPDRNIRLHVMTKLLPLVSIETPSPVAGPVR